MQSQCREPRARVLVSVPCVASHSCVPAQRNPRKSTETPLELPGSTGKSLGLFTVAFEQTQDCGAGLQEGLSPVDAIVT